MDEEICLVLIFAFYKELRTRYVIIKLFFHVLSNSFPWVYPFIHVPCLSLLAHKSRSLGR
jgi:hypothetical protein